MGHSLKKVFKAFVSLKENCGRKQHRRRESLGTGLGTKNFYFEAIISYSSIALHKSFGPSTLPVHLSTAGNRTCGALGSPKYQGSLSMEKYL